MEWKKVNIPTYHFKDRVKHQYNNVHLALIRELLQNSRDAGAKNIWFTIDNNSLICKDDGCSMTANEFEMFYLNLGGTFKQTDSIGGFGAAKELTFACDSWSVIGRDFLCSGKGCEYQVSPFTPQKGSLSP